MINYIGKAAEIISLSKNTVAFTGAGISVESGIPPFRGTSGLWSKYDPMLLDINYFTSHPERSWKAIKEIFYDFLSSAKPNPGHIALARMEEASLLQAIITQNIDNLHQQAGSKVIYEYHGNSQKLVCMKCATVYEAGEVTITDELPPKCAKCRGILKPNFIFFGEGIPEYAARMSVEAGYSCEVFIIIGTSGEVMPANLLPGMASQNGAKIIEINTEPSKYTRSVTDVFLQGKASEVLTSLLCELNLK